MHEPFEVVMCDDGCANRWAIADTEPLKAMLGVCERVFAKNGTIES
jgi:hypothetical protein